MKRRQFLAIPALAFTTGVALAAGGTFVEYTPEAYKEALESGEPFMLDFYAPW